MDSIPQDQETRQKIVDIINHQFDLEIYLKQREVATIRNEISKAEHVLQDLKLAVENESMAASMPESAHYTRRSAMYFQGGSQALLQQQQQQQQQQSAPRRKTYRTSEKSKLYGRRNDGVFVSLACPVCLRDDLLNLQGFLNHCRISHNLEFGPYEQVMLQCGTPVDESEVPMDNPARLRPIMNLTPSAAKPQKKLERPSIKVFEEDVDMELENERKSSQKAAQEEETMAAIESSTSSAVEEDAETSAPTVNTPTPSISTIAAVDTELTHATHNNNQDTPTAPVIESTVESTVEAPQKPDNTHVPLEAEPLEAAPIDTTVATSTSSKDTQKETEADKSQEPAAAAAAPAKIESFAAAMSSGTASDIGSRFYIKRRILVGNVSKFISPERRDPALKQFTHKWMIYVVEPPQSKQPVGAFITCVRFHLHPSYKPNDVVDVTEPPFKLTRFGWGEFPIRIQLFFVDKKRNKAVDLIHHLKLDNLHSGKQLLGGERSIEIELDRNTDFKDTTMSPVPTPTQSAPQTPASSAVQQDPFSSSSTTAATAAAEVPVAAPQPTPQEIQAQQQKEQEALQTMAVKQKMSLLNGILKESVRRLPIVRAGSHGTVLPYSCATSSKQFFEWSVGKRKALEWHRARLLRLETQKRAHASNETVLRLAADALTTKDVVLWCRGNKYTPVQSDTIEDVRASDVAPGYCKFCGSVRDGHDATVDDHCPRRPKGWNSSRKRGGINSTTSVSRLLATLEAGWDHVLSEKEDDDMDIDVDMDQPPPQYHDDATTTTTTAETAAAESRDLVQRIQACALDEDKMDVAHERSLDWIWSVVGQLRLKSVIANDMLLAKDGNLQGPTSSFDLAAAMKQRLVVGNVLTQATRVFLKKLVQETVHTCRKEEQGSADKSTKMMVPYHIFQAAQRRQEFDFLTNQYMGPEEQ